MASQSGSLPISFYFKDAFPCFFSCYIFLVQSLEKLNNRVLRIDKGIMLKKERFALTKTSHINPLYRVWVFSVFQIGWDETLMASLSPLLMEVWYEVLKKVFEMHGHPHPVANMLYLTEHSLWIWAVGVQEFCPKHKANCHNFVNLRVHFPSRKGQPAMPGCTSCCPSQSLTWKC